MQRILLTGASGFLGSALALNLSQAGYHLTLLLRSSSRLNRLTGRESTLEICRFRTYDEVTDIVAKIEPDLVIHTACCYGRKGESNVELLETNILYGLNILQGLIATNKSATFINTSSVLPPDASPYALTKDQFVQWGRALAAQSNRLRFINVRLQHMYGPGDDPSKFSTHVLQACHRNEPELKLTAGEQKRDFVYIDDVVNAYSTLIENCDSFKSACDVDVGTGIAPSIKQFVETVHALTGSKTKLLFGDVPYRSNESMHCQADITKMLGLGWIPKYDLISGLKRTIDMEFHK